MHAALEKSALWPEVVADAEKAANGEQYDKSHARQLFDQLAKVARPLRENEISTTNPESAQLASRALGLSARLAERLGRNELDRKGAADALAELNQAIAAYEEHAAAEEARCAQPEAGATPVNGAEATPVTGRGATPVAR